MPTKFEVRIAASLKALCVMWLISGALFSVIVKGPGTVSAWVIWGTGVFLAGWITVGLPILALGDRVRHIPYVLLACIGGLGGALLMFSPNAIARLMDAKMHYAPFSIRDLAWPGVAFWVAAPTTALYRLFLDRARVPKTKVELST